jgi:MFS-type transporter involved in bile tolerance (Atg22 family)
MPIFSHEKHYMQTADRKVVNGWAMYDWANSAYNLVITTTIFPAYYDAITTSRERWRSKPQSSVPWVGIRKRFIV